MFIFFMLTTKLFTVIFIDACTVLYGWSCICFQALWHSRILRYFQNSRARRDCKLTVVCNRKRTASDRSVFRPVVSCAFYGVKHYLPSRQPGETDDTVAAMIKRMDDESRKWKPNKGRIAELMDATFADRRQLIVVEKAPVERIKDTYPCLFNEDEVSKRFSKLIYLFVLNLYLLILESILLVCSVFVRFLQRVRALY